MPKSRGKRPPTRSKSPSHDLKAVKKAIAAGPEFGSFVTCKALDEAAELGFDQDTIYLCILELREDEFHESVASNFLPGDWLDVYRHRFRGKELYIKFKMSVPGGPVVISFHDWEGET